MSLLRSQSSMSRTRRYFYLFLKECFLTIGANWACACSYSALSLIGTSIADSCALQVWKEGRFSLLISDHKIFWSFELNDLWSKKICRSKMIVWSGATFILRWSCLLDLLDNWTNNFVFFCALFLHFPLQKNLYRRFIDLKSLFSLQDISLFESDSFQWKMYVTGFTSFREEVKIRFLGNFPE